MKTNNVTVSAPGKLMLFGEHAVVYGRPCIVTAVDQRLKLTLEITDSDECIIHAPEVDVTDYKKNMSELGNGDVPKGVQFLEQALVNFKHEYELEGGLSVTTSSEFSSQFGFGSSSAAVVCMIYALSQSVEKNLSLHDVFALSYKTILDVQGKGSGFDVAAAVFGKTLYFETGGKEIRELSLSELPLIVGYTGVKADTVKIVDQVAKKRTEEGEKIEMIFDAIEQIVKKSEKYITEGNWDVVGNLMNENQELLKKLGVSSEKLDNLITSAIDAGAYGAKLSGAGGGDCMIALAPPDKKEAVEQSIEKAGGTVMRVKTNGEGVRVEK